VNCGRSMIGLSHNRGGLQSNSESPFAPSLSVFQSSYRRARVRCA